MFFINSFYIFYKIVLLYFFSFFQGMQTRERAHCARSVFPFTKKKYIYIYILWGAGRDFFGERKGELLPEVRTSNKQNLFPRAGTQSSTHLLTSPPGHLVTSELRHQSVGLAGINTGSDSQGDISSGIVALTTSFTLSSSSSSHSWGRNLPRSRPLRGRQ